MKRLILTSSVLLFLAGALQAEEAIPGCAPPTSPRFDPIPFPNPRTDSEIIADFEHCYLVLHETNLAGRLVNGWRNLARHLGGIRGWSGPSAEESHLVRLIRAGRVAYEILRFEDWHERRRRKTEGPRKGYLVRAFETGSPEGELARWMLGEDGGWRTGTHTPVRAESRASDRRIPGRLLSLAEAQGRLEERWGTVENLRYVVFGFGPVGRVHLCVDLLRPCLAFTAPGGRFLYSPEEAQLFRVRSELGTFQIDMRDEVSRLEGQLSIARAMDVERDLVFGMGDELGIARRIEDGAPP